MGLLLAIVAVAGAVQLGQHVAIFVVDVLATLTAAVHYWRRDRLYHVISAAPASRRCRRLLARHLRLSMAMTAHHSLFPSSSRRGYALAQALVGR